MKIEQIKKGEELLRELNTYKNTLNYLKEIRESFLKEYNITFRHWADRCPSDSLERTFNLRLSDEDLIEFLKATEKILEKRISILKKEIEEL